MDRVKESMFAIVQDYIKDSVCLDLFAGTGNLGIEAISNGAKKVYFNDRNKDILKLIYRKKLLKKNGIVICEFQNEEISTEYFTVERQKTYGYRKVCIYTEKK